ncbi:lysine--tRNA ligase [Rubrimonas cliftonensis]|uniref:Lysine--tRNA ligase n=1 Tax=Rubrimonas cliftonensis TaxID=89524 RepID=A0A1H3VE60_9RHOB|nr:lysine--tRNA ligase [Rubrimonas cliftonensis]SDZ73020.1 lysyl-tRNA synthetase, class I [Rubrimonas cliftonensis]
MSSQRELAEKARAWPFEEARKLLKRLGAGDPEKGHVLFETGYGPSGLPHIGTFGEVARTTMVRRAFEMLCDVPTRLLCFSDDMDGMRKAPENVPDPEALKAHLQLPLTAVPDPFGKFESFGAHNNAMLRRFLDTFGFDYEFASATDYYKSGRMDDILIRCAERYDAIMAIMLKTLGEERQATYSCFLPISPTTGRVLYVPIRNVDAKRGEITFDDEDGTETTLPVTGGQVKLQWKPDFGARWAALGVDFEMYGKDHLPNTPVYDGICSALGGRPPQHYVYELFLDEEGRKISKSKGNGVSIDEWLRYASSESLSLFMFQKPRTAKRLHWDVIPKTVDEYDQHLRAFPEQDDAQRLENPVWHIHAGTPPESQMAVPFAMLLNLAAAAGAQDKAVLWGFIHKYAPEASPQTHPALDAAVGRALNYVADKVLPNRRFRAPTGTERAALADLAGELRAWTGGADAGALQDLVYEVGKRHPFENLRDWFGALYAVLLGAEQGPRFGGFVALYGVAETAALIERALAGELVGA